MSNVINSALGSMSNIWAQMQNYALLSPYFLKELDRKYNPLTTMRKLNENDDDLPQSLKGKVCLITGGTRGIGAEVVKALLRKDCYVITGSSSKSQKEIDQRHKNLMEGIPKGKGKLEIWNLDLFSMSSVVQFAVKFKNSKLHLNYFVANAGIFFQEQKYNEEGFESHYAINYLSQCLLIYYLLPTLVETGRQPNSGESRIVLTSSGFHDAANIKFDDLQLKTSYFRFFAYVQSKLAQVMFTYKLSRWLDNKSDWGQMVKVHSLHPGICNTELASNIGFGSEMTPIIDSAVRVCYS